MRIIIDTNILIQREDNKELKEEIKKLMQLFNRENYQIIMHPDSIIDIKNDLNEERKKITLSKLETYPLLEHPPEYKNDKEFIKKIPNFEKLNSHDLIDLSILYSLYKNAVCYLITEDKKIHTWANLLEIESCYNVGEALEIFTKIKSQLESVFHPISIENIPLSHLNLEDPFFDDLREDYGKEDFNKWFISKAQKGMKAYVNLDKDDSIGAFLMLKEEKNESIGNTSKPIFKEKILKIATLKVKHTKYGKKIGELFLNISFNYAMKNGFDEIYLTHYIKENDHLIPLIERFGFIKSEVGISRTNNSEIEAIYFKSIKTEENKSPEEIRKYYFPSFYDGKKSKKFVIPIKPKWHDLLFPNIENSQTLLEFFGDFSTQGNSILKAYLCHSNCKKMNKGDIVLFYRSERNQKITALGTIDKVYYNINSVDKTAKIVGKRTVYKLSDIDKMIQKKPITIILFKYHFELPKKLSYNNLFNKRILYNYPQSILELDISRYLKFKRESKIPLEFTHWKKE
ncbi:MAG: EVE domain-containing protein [Nanoarchaeota archaeon]